jgi:glyoxylase-like metal-dependent hydrolase (beta-lactamase superfamily II)
LPTSEYFRLQQVGEGIYAAIIVPGKGAMGNAGIVDLGDRTLVFDTFLTPEPARDLRMAAERLTGRPVAYVVNSHYHADHTHGNQVFEDATILATETTRGLITTNGPALIATLSAHPESIHEAEEQLAHVQDEATRRSLEADLGDTRALYAALPALTIRPPDVAFAGNAHLHGARRRADLLAFSGHTDSDAILVLPNEGIGLLGDLAWVRSHPSTWFGRPREWVRTLSELERLDLRVIVPGHGPVGTAEDIQALRRYLEELLQLAERAVASGASADEAVRTPIPAAYAAWEGPDLFAQSMRFLHGYVARPDSEQAQA